MEKAGISYTVVVSEGNGVERYSTYSTLEEAISVADRISTWNPGTIEVWEKANRLVYVPKNIPSRRI